MDFSKGIVGNPLSSSGRNRPTSSVKPVHAWQIPCLRVGTKIATLRGMRPIETLSEGDRIITHSRGSQRLKMIWQFRSDIELDADALGPDSSAAVVIEAGAFGDMRPMERLIVSPQTPVFVRMSRGSGQRNRYHDTVPAKYLVNDDTVVPRAGTSSDIYYAIGFERPEVIQAENLPLMCMSADQIAKFTGTPLDNTLTTAEIEGRETCKAG